jgi:hypothetical protein
MMYDVAMKYFYFCGNVVKGPISFRQLQILIKNHVIEPETLICAEGTNKWFKVDELLRESNKTTYSTKKLPNRKESNSFLSTVLIFLATLSIGGGFIMGIVSFGAGLIGIGMGYILGGAVVAVLWYTLYILLARK